ncbi:YkgJ family cysteine cluster protein [Magnetofaba australis]|uniref:Fe-S oxidoreductase n=1 Tax=Magnetofaba australis IT-1 TaxID=1434232 RepID=A0A1Y2K238_9PROT|nr:YkgJ family cysteine cluster protein [Magnetofaba australis]OSM02088.1 hypothetical protein MAIT1_02174 [Magnetofaba australis IT-1]
MSNADKSKPDPDHLHERARLNMLDEELHAMPAELLELLHPTKLGADDRFQFGCHPGVSCFNECCKNIEIVLTPYDMVRLRNRLEVDAETFLHDYATPMTLPKGKLPIVIIRMDPESGRCPFNSDAGCSVYSDRPAACRNYPVCMALTHKDDAHSKPESVVIHETFCQGHQEPGQWTVAEWRKDQGADGYDARNQGWMDIIVRRRGQEGELSSGLQGLLELFFTAGANPAEFRKFVFQSSFLSRYQLDPDTEARIRHNDEALMEFAFQWLNGALFGDQEQPESEGDA